MTRQQLILFVTTCLLVLGLRTNAQETGWRGEYKQHVLSAQTKFLATQAVANGRKEVLVIVAANKGRTEEVNQLIAHADGRVLTSIPAIGYIHAVVPLQKLWWLLQQNAVTDVSMANDTQLHGDFRSYDPPRVEETNLAAKLQSEKEDHELDILNKASREKGKLWGDVDLSLPLLDPDSLEVLPGLNANVYLQQPQWLSSHPTWDGRGVTILSEESAPGLDHPSLQQAKDINGNLIPKIVGIQGGIDNAHRELLKKLLGTSPADDFDEVRFGADAALPDGTRCPSPESAEDRVGVWEAGHYGWQMTYCVEWDPRARVARIDLNQNGRFDDDQPLHDFNESHEFVTVPYTAKIADGQSKHHFTACLSYDPLTGTVSILPTDGDHTAMTATAAAGSGFMGTSIGGMAPSARLMFFVGVSISDHIEGFWKALSRPDVDLVTSSGSLGGDVFPSEPRTLAMMFYDRMIETTGKPIIDAAGNWGLPFEEVYDHSRLLIGAGGYISRDQMQAFRFSDRPLNVPLADYVFDDGAGSSSGPATDGSLGISVLAPEMGIAGTDCGSDHYSGEARSAQVGLTYRLPPCYAISGGTSSAAPRVAGAVALLLSAAKQEHLHVTPEQIKNALIVSARFLPDQPAYRQGGGLLQVEDAWNALQEMAQKPAVFVSSRTPDIAPLYPQFWRGPRIGQSVYVTRGFRPGEKKRVTLDLEITGIAPRDLSFQLLGNDGTYHIASWKPTARGQVTVLVDALATSTGNKSALLEVRARGWRYPIARLPILLVATPSPQSLRSGVTLTGKYGIVSSEFFLFEPPQGTAALEFTGTAEGSPLSAEFVTGTESPLTFNPSHGIDFAGLIMNGTRTFIVPTPHPDLVGIKLENEETESDPCCTTDFKLKVRALTTSELTKSASSDSPMFVSTQTVHLQATQMPETPVHAADIVVPEGADAALISFPQVAFRASEPYATEMYLYDPQGKRQGLWNYYPVIDRSTRLAIAKPRAGTWKLVTLGADPGVIQVEFLQLSSATGVDGRRYLPFGALCSGASCADTWPLDDPFWRFLPLFALPGQQESSKNVPLANKP